MGASTLIGNEVYSLDEDDLGKIKEIRLDTGDDSVAYAVLSIGGVLGMANKLSAVPWNALKLDTENKRFVLNVDGDRPKDATGFDKSAWPSMADKRWGGQEHDYYGTGHYWDH